VGALERGLGGWVVHPKSIRALPKKETLLFRQQECLLHIKGNVMSSFLALVFGNCLHRGLSLFPVVQNAAQK